MRIGIIGGGASGVVAAIEASKKGNEVILFEKNDKLLKKLLLTGNGRCNFMHSEYHMSDYHSQCPNLIEEFICDKNIEDVRLFFEDLGILTREKDGNIYPVTNQAITIWDALVREVERCGVQVFYHTSITGIKKKRDQFLIQYDDREIYCDKVIVASGSFAYPKTGSDGSFYKILKKMGHTIVDVVPALVQLESDFSYCKNWDGVRCDALLKLYEDGEEIAQEAGEVQFTDYGISGICTFNLSHFISRGLHTGHSEVIKIDFVPFIEAILIPWLDRYSKRGHFNNIFEMLGGVLNKKIVGILLKCSHIREDVSYDDLTNEEKLTLAKNMRSFPITITGTKDFSSSQVCNGGVMLDEVDPNTMESLLIPGLYIVGELLDLTGNCGGFNLTECWISGMIAGRCVND